jgi:stress response protein YsnF
MPDEHPVDRDVVVPIVQEQVHVDAVPVVTGGVRVTKHVESQDEIVEQQLRTSHADVKRVKTNRVVDGPQPAQRIGNTLIIPVVSEVLHVEKRWIVTEEIHITQREEVETVQQTVAVNYEQAEIERLDEDGNVVPGAEVPVEQASGSRSLVARTDAAAQKTAKPLSSRRSMLRDKNPQAGKR